MIISSIISFMPMPSIPLLMGCLLFFSLNICHGRDMPIDPDPFHNSDEAKAVIPKMIKDFVANPSEFGLGRIVYMCMRVPDETREGRDIKLTLMLQFIAMIDAVWIGKVPTATNTVFIPSSWGLPPGTDPEKIKDPILQAKYAALVKANEAQMHYHNIQGMLQRFRIGYFKYIPLYIKCKYTETEYGHVKNIVQGQLKNDPKAKDLLDAFLAAKPLLPPESIPSQ